MRNAGVIVHLQAEWQNLTWRISLFTLFTPNYLPVNHHPSSPDFFAFLILFSFLPSSFSFSSCCYFVHSSFFPYCSSGYFTTSSCICFCSKSFSSFSSPPPLPPAPTSPCFHLHLYPLCTPSVPLLYPIFTPSVPLLLFFLLYTIPFLFLYLLFSALSLS